MAQICAAVNTPFIPEVGSFIVQCSAGAVALGRSAVTGGPYTDCGQITANSSFIVDNPVAGAEYRFTTISGTPVVRADQ